MGITIFAFRETGTTPQLDGAAVYQNIATGTGVTIPALIATGPNEILICAFVDENGYSWTTPSGFTAEPPLQFSSFTWQYPFRQQLTASGSTGTISSTQAGSGGATGWAVLIKSGLAATVNLAGASVGSSRVIATFSDIPLPKMSTLVDNFNSGTLSPAKWSNPSPARITNTANQLQFTTLSSSAYYALYAQTFYDLSNSYFLVQVVNPGNQALGSLEVYPIYLQDPSGQSVLFFLISGGNISAWQKVSGTNTNLSGYTPYDPVNMLWLRVREAAGVVYYETSPEGQIWTVFYSLADPFQVTDLQPVIQVGTYLAEPSTTTVIFDNVNSPPSVAGRSKAAALVVGSLVKIRSLSGRTHGRTQVSGILRVNTLRSLSGRSRGTAIDVANFGQLVMVGRVRGSSQVFAIMPTQLFAVGQPGTSLVIGQFSISSIFSTGYTSGHAMARLRLNLIVVMPGRARGTSQVRARLMSYAVGRSRPAGHAQVRSSLRVVPAFRGPGRTAGRAVVAGHLDYGRKLAARCSARSQARAHLTIYPARSIYGRGRGTATTRGALTVAGQPFVGWGAGVEQ